MRQLTFLFFIAISILLSSCDNKTQETTDTDSPKYTNSLVNESSPYLLQHAHNPVNWYPWGDEALDKAQAENKLIIISVGYSSCHWCHVMEHESFEDTVVARLMNENFINVKVDREERPDVDDVYMTACHLSGGGSCGWPLNAICLPDGRPFFAGTYFPKDNWMKILRDILTLNENNPDRLEQYAASLSDGVRRNSLIQAAETEREFEMDGIKAVGDKFITTIDMEKGGRHVDGVNATNKFPMPNNYLFFLRYFAATGNEDALKAVQVTLDNMSMGGIYDHLRGGFARYSTDPEWKVPHFEKMLYDNGQIVSLYAEAYQLTKDPRYKKVVFETLDFIKAEMTSEEGGFYSSLDASTDGEEGVFYTWDKAEIDSLLGTEAEVFNAFYNVSQKGNWEHRNILYQTKPLSEIATSFDLTVEALEQQLSKNRMTLLEARNNRIRPGLDEKILTSWNALMLKGYIDAYRAFGEEEFLNVALQNANFLVKIAIKKDNRLTRNYKDGNSVINAFLDDYALLIDAFIALYQATFDETWLTRARDLTEYAKTQFFDEVSGMFYYTSGLDKELIARKMELNDNVIPASNSIMARNLYHLGLYFYDENYMEMASTMMNNMLDPVQNADQPSFYSNWCALYLELAKEPHEVAIVGDEFKAFRKEWDQNYNPNVLLMGGKSEGTLELLKNKLIEDQTTIYVCKKKVCKFPVTEVSKALGLLD
ncbi:MAG: thioredoxin domain-containing protein [Bacteroidota bacterium]